MAFTIKDYFSGITRESSSDSDLPRFIQAFVLEYLDEWNLVEDPGHSYKEPDKGEIMDKALRGDFDYLAKVLEVHGFILEKT